MVHYRDVQSVHCVLYSTIQTHRIARHLYHIETCHGYPLVPNHDRHADVQLEHVLTIVTGVKDKLKLLHRNKYLAGRKSSRRAAIQIWR